MQAAKAEHAEQLKIGELSAKSLPSATGLEMPAKASSSSL
jgi:hypothetical protein